MKNCLNCSKKIIRGQQKYCSNRCQQYYQYKVYIRAWKTGTVDGNRGIVTKNISSHIKRYLISKYGEQCSVCHWSERHFLTSRVPLEIDHMNGNSSDNSEPNLRLVCPNCHSLSASFRNLNKGNGRLWRRNYLKRHLIKYN